jgi:flagellar biosynthesis GTPase FlhF
VSTTADAADALLEREHNLEFLDGLLAAVQSESQGRVMLVGGEAGVGKTTPSAPVLRSAAPLGPAAVGRL